MTICFDNSDELFTFNDLQTELKMCGNYTLIFIPILIQTSLNSDKPHEEGTEYNHIELISNLSDESQQLYEQRLRDVIEDIIELGYYRKVH